MDSLELVIGDVSQGGTVIQEIAMHNFGESAILLKAGQSSPFVSVTYKTNNLAPGQSTIAMVNFEAIKELPLGINHIEVVVDTDDELNASKFFYLVANLVEDSTQFLDYVTLDTVPRMIFDHYNYDFGHLHRGKKVQHTFLFTNLGDKDLVVSEVHASNGCKILKYPEQIVGPGEGGSVVVKVKTKGAVGIQHRTITIYSNDPVTPVIILGMHGMIRIKPPGTENPRFCDD